MNRTYTLRVQELNHVYPQLVGSVDELPDVAEYADTLRDVLELLVDTIATTEEYLSMENSVPASLSDQLELEAAILPDFHPIAAPRVRALLLAASVALKDGK